MHGEVVHFKELIKKKVLFKERLCIHRMYSAQKICSPGVRHLEVVHFTGAFFRGSAHYEECTRMREMFPLELHHFRYILHSEEVPVDSKNKRIINTINSSIIIFNLVNAVNISEVNLITTKCYRIEAEPEYVGT